MRYFDASALVKRYLLETGSAAVRRRLESERSATCRLSEVEVASTLFRRAREGALSEAERDRAIDSLRADLLEMDIVELTPGIAGRARVILGRQALRAGDAIQLASCLVLREGLLDEEVRFVAFDERLVQAARNEGLVTST